ncbi:hypothetical protein ACFE04_012916 [Oxalis oulophora]
MEEEEAIRRGASQDVSREFNTLIDANDLDSIKQLQHLIMGRLQDSNAVLSHFNDFSENCFAELSAHFATNTRLLKSIKSDLDYIFLKLRYFIAFTCGCSHLITGFLTLDALINQTISLPNLKDSWEGSTSILAATKYLSCISVWLILSPIALKSMKAKVQATYPDAFPNESAREALDQRPNLELP